MRGGGHGGSSGVAEGVGFRLCENSADGRGIPAKKTSPAEGRGRRYEVQSFPTADALGEI